MSSPTYRTSSAASGSCVRAWVRAGCGMRSGVGWFSGPRSAAVRTRWTPGSARARGGSRGGQCGGGAAGERPAPAPQEGELPEPRLAVRIRDRDVVEADLAWGQAPRPRIRARPLAVGDLGQRHVVMVDLAPLV